MGHNPFDQDYWDEVKAAGGETKEQYKHRVETHLKWSLNTLERAGYTVWRPDEFTIVVGDRITIELDRKGAAVPVSWSDNRNDDTGKFDAKNRRIDYWIQEHYPLDK